jgi:dipeptidyl aminopeptidase/acylaminoacyl peptidase
MRRPLLLLLGFVCACGGAADANGPARRTSVLREIASSVPKAPPPPKAPPRADASLLPRHALFANPDRAMPLLSHDGKRLAYLSNVDGVLNVWVAKTNDVASAKPVTHDVKRGIRIYKWAHTNEHILYLQDKDGDENWHLHAVDLKSGDDRDLTPIDGVQARIEALSWKVPGEALVGLNDRDKRFHDVWRIDLRTGKKTLVQQNDGFSAFVTDDDFKIRFGMKPEKDGSTDILAPDAKGKLEPYAKIPHEDSLTTFVASFDKDGKKAYLVDSRGRDTAGLVELDVASKQTKVLVEDGQADVREVVVHPTKKHVEAVLSSYDRMRWHVVDAAFKKDFDALETNLGNAGVKGADIQLASRSLDESKWLVAAVVSDGPVKFFLHERTSPKEWKTTYLFSNSKAFEDAKLSRMHPVIVRSRDGLDLVSYLTLPRDADADGDARPDKGPLPMVLFVHGGPWSRDEYGLNRWHQWLASRGYAVLSVNYRGSTGFGKKFVNAADREWAGKMHDDLVDATAWAIAQKIAEKDRVAIMGGSYGGYSTLVGLTFTPETFACGVDIVGPSNLVTLLSSIPPYWEVEVEQFTKRIGDHRTEEGRKLLLSRSPLTFVDRIKRPLLIGQGANDPRVKQAESDQIVKAMQAKGTPVTYVLYPDEGHGFARPENRTSFNAVSEIFLAQCLGGPYEPIGQDFKGASITVPAGKENIYSLGDALK